MNPYERMAPPVSVASRIILEASTKGSTISNDQLHNFSFLTLFISQCICFTNLIAHLLTAI